MITEHAASGGCVRAGVGALASAATGLFVGGLAVSRFAIDHDLPLPPAIAADQTRFHSPAGGYCNYYYDVPDDPDEATPLVLIHSINAAPSAHEMQPLFERYRGRRPVYALELPGFGFSDRAPRRYTPEVFSGTIIDFLRDVVGQPADVVALSLSSEFCARAALAQPQMFRSLAFLSPTGLSDPYPKQGPGEWVQRAVAFPLWAQALYDGLTSKSSIRFFLGRQFYGTAPQWFIDYAYATAHQRGARHAPFWFLGAQLFTWTARDTLYKPLMRPVLVLYDEDPNVNFKRLPEVLAANPRWQAQRIVPTRGLPHWEQLDATATALETFWAQVAA